MSAWIIIAVSLTYIALLFAIAYYGDRRARTSSGSRSRPIVYSLSLAVYCTSWTFFGSVGRAASSGWDFLPIYLGPIIALLVFAPVLRKIILISKQQNITSIADFIASRYGKTQGLAALVTVMAVAVILPYIALQLKGVELAFDTLSQGAASSPDAGAPPHPLLDTALYVALALAVFSMLFGTRHVDTSESHQGIIYAIAFESIIKLAAFLAVGLFVVFGMYNGFGDLFVQARRNPEFVALFEHHPLSASFVTTTVLAVAAIFCLPRQFHVGVVENTDPRDLRTARWLFPLYLAAFSVFMIPIAAAGLLTFPPGSVGADRFVLALPLAANAPGLALWAAIGGFSAATSMVIMATVALATMVCNDVVMPPLMRIRALRLSQRADLSRLLILTRRAVILLLLLCAYGYYRLFGDAVMLASIGLLSFAGIAQFLPALIGGIYINGISRRAVIAGLGAGFAVWVYTLLLPNLAAVGLLPKTIVTDGPFAIAWLRPQSLLGLALGDPVSHGVVWSLAVNIAVTAVTNLFTSRSLIERMQAGAFVHLGGGNRGHPEAGSSTATVGDIQIVLQRFLGVQGAQDALANHAARRNLSLQPRALADKHLLADCERLLAGVIGGSSARLVLQSAIHHKDLAIDDVVDILDQTSEAVAFNRALLQAALDNLSQGVSVVDSDLRLVAWNRRYLSLFDYPDGMVHVGQHVSKLIRYNAEHGELGPGSVEEHIHKRLQHMRIGDSHVFQRVRTDGTVLEMHGNPMPGGGFVTTFTDISEHVRNQQALAHANVTLEQRVTERTVALSRANADLQRENNERRKLENDARRARDEAERANRSKTRFLAAAGHDLMQPLNAARLFASTLRGDGESVPKAAENIERALESAESLLGGLLDISKLDSNAWETQITDFPIDDILQGLTAQFELLASQRGLRLRVVTSRAVVRSDRRLLRRVLQNFLSNAVRHTKAGQILLGCRRESGAVRIEVWDTGPGIPSSELRNVFEEFHRLGKPDAHASGGLGLGLAIAERIVKLLDHDLNVRSWPGRGSVFSVTVKRGRANVLRPADTAAAKMLPGTLSDVAVLCIDDDPHVREGLAAVLRGWSCRISIASGRAELPDAAPDIVLADYHLQGEENGLSLIAELRNRWGEELPAILITAERGEVLRESLHATGVTLLRKPIKPAALRAALSHALDQANAGTAQSA